ncbi:MAG: hypothetical protein ACYDBJ_13950 [Aggregatilineales bacterium]
MTTSTHADQPASRELRNRHRAFAIGMLSGPTLWAIQIGIGYALVPPACSTGSKLPLFALAAITGVLTFIAGAVAWQQWQLATRNRLMDLDDPTMPRSFLGSLGVCMSLLFLLLILATGIVTILLSPCPLLTMTVP